MNKNAVKFAKDLCATFNKYPIAEDTRTQIVIQMSKHYLTSDQWIQVLDTIIANRDKDDKGLPEPPEIMAAVKAVKSQRASENKYGFCTFNIDGRSFAIRVVMDDNKWVSVKTKEPPLPPWNATDIAIYPDNPPMPDPRDIPSDRERAVIIATIQRNLLRVAGGKVQIDRQPVDETPVGEMREPLPDTETDEVPW